MCPYVLYICIENYWQEGCDCCPCTTSEKPVQTYGNSTYPR